MQNEELISTQSMLLDLSEKYQYLHNYSPVGYLSIGIDGLIKEGNQAFADLVGTPPERLLDKSI